MNPNPEINNYVKIYLDGVEQNKDVVSVSTEYPVSPIDGYDGPGILVRLGPDGQPTELSEGQIRIEMGPRA